MKIEQPNEQIKIILSTTYIYIYIQMSCDTS